MQRVLVLGVAAAALGLGAVVWWSRSADETTFAVLHAPEKVGRKAGAITANPETSLIMPPPLASL